MNLRNHTLQLNRKNTFFWHIQIFTYPEFFFIGFRLISKSVLIISTTYSLIFIVYFESKPITF
jgi:hypothetical protein